MKILVTGGAGFIGSHVAEHYIKAGEDVVVLDNLSRMRLLGTHARNALYNWNYLHENYAKIQLVKGDVRRLEEVKRVSKGVDAIVHAAAQVAVTTSLKNPLLDFEINARGTLNVLEAARINDAAIVYTSTNKVYGENVNKIPVKKRGKRYYFADAKYKNGIDEDFPVDLCGHSPYGCSKLAADLYVQDYGSTYGMKTGVFRLSCIYGERQVGVEDQGWLSWFAIATLTNKHLTIYGDGKQVRDALWVDDLVSAFDKFIRSKLRHEVFNIGGGPKNTLSLLELLDLMQKLTGKRAKISFTEWRKADQRVYVSAIPKIWRKLKWKPRVRLSAGVERMLTWVSENLTLFP